MIQVVLFQLFIVLTIQKLSVHVPLELANKFASQNQSIPYSVANFGHIPWGRKIIGTLLLAEPYNACNPIEINRTQIQEQKFFLLVERGGCSLVQKVRNAQLAGASFAIVVDSYFEDSVKLTMVDDGYGSTVQIPSVLIPKEEGDVLRNYLDQQIQIEREDPSQYQSVVMVMKFDTIVSDKTYVYFGLQLTNRETFKIIREFKQHYLQLKNKKIVFDIFFDQFPCSSCALDDYQQPQQDCLGGGRYCVVDPDGRDIATGRDILEEELRSSCIFKLYRDKWFDYMDEFDSNCILVQNYEQCSIDIRKKLRISSEKVFKCVQNSFDSSIQQDRLLQANQILDQQQFYVQFKNSTGLLFYPGFVINNQTYKGDLNADDVFGEICNSMQSPPQYCQQFMDEYIRKGSGESSNILGIALFVLGALLIFFFFMVFFYKRMVRTELREETMGKVDQMVVQYIDFYESKEKH